MRQVPLPGPAEAPPREPRGWRPLLSGSLADQARAVVAEIADVLREPSGVGWDQPGLTRGASGHAILYSYLAECELTENAAQAAGLFEERARSLIARTPGTLSLYDGLTGVGTAAIWSRRLASRPYAEKLGRTIDLVIARALQTDLRKAGFDLMLGLVGLGVYAGFRVAEPTSPEILERIVELLEDFAEVTPDGIAWPSRPEFLTERLIKLYPNGFHDLGLAHGAPGVIAFLSHCVHLGVDPERARRLVTETMPWLRSQRHPDPAPPRYPNRVEPGKPVGKGRIAWCHGDPSVAIAMLVAGRLLEVPEWEREAIDLARNAAHCAPSSDGIFDTCLCHGAAGVGHVYNRMSQQTGDRELEDVARRWFERALQMLEPGNVMAGFPSLVPELKMGHGMLMGAAGVALAFASAISSVPPDWDRVLLLSWPEPERTRVLP